jgi:hypothetical protein
MVGYGGGVHEEKSVASNAISFDLNDAGVATLANPGVSSARQTGNLIIGIHSNQ